MDQWDNLAAAQRRLQLRRAIVNMVPALAQFLGGVAHETPEDQLVRERMYEQILTQLQTLRGTDDGCTRNRGGEQ
jgi:hypothetical protein